MAFNITPEFLLSGANTVGNLLSQITNTDVVQVLNQTTMQQVFGGARPVKARVRESARVMDYPVETGVLLSDHRISNPTEIELTCIIPSGQYSIAYPTIRTAWQLGTLLSVQTRLGTYKNMIISDLPHEEEPDMFSAVTMDIKLREVIYTVPSSIAGSGLLANYSPRNPAMNSITVGSGILSSTAAAGSALSYLHAATVFGIKI